MTIITCSIQTVKILVHPETGGEFPDIFSMPQRLALPSSGPCQLFSEMYNKCHPDETVVLHT
jgi:hypothetical protein